MECDFIPGQEAWIEDLAGRAPWDYLIGSVHYIERGWDVDNPKWADRWRPDRVDEIWGMYWSRLEKCIRSGLFDIIAHPDLPKKFGHRASGDLRRFYDPAIQAASDKNVAFEINTAGLHKECAEFYPAAEFLILAREANIPIVISSDAHDPAHVGRDFEAAITGAIALGYDSIAWFVNRERHDAPLP
jgi:histidinol-phosphatase (PHP family)